MDQEFFASIVGPEAVGVTPTGRLVLSPDTYECVGNVLARAGEEGFKLALREAATPPFGRSEPGPGTALLSLSRLSRILDVDAPNLTAKVQAGVDLRLLAAELARSGVQWPVRPFPGHTLLAESIVTGLAVVESATFPDLRHWVLGSKWALGHGEIIQAGGKTVKNAAGYDVTRALTGTLGFFAVPVELQLRLRPVPGATAAVAIPAAPPAVALVMGKLEIAGSLALWAAPGSGAAGIVTLNGSAAAVASAAVVLADTSVEEASDGVDAVRALETLSQLNTAPWIKWIAGPAACARIVAAIANDLPEAGAVAFPLARWGLARGTTMGGLAALIREHGGKPWRWPEDFTGPSLIGTDATGGLYAALGRAFDPQGVLV